MQKTYFIQSMEKFGKYLRNLNSVIENCDDCEVVNALDPLMEALGFTVNDDGTYGMPRIYSCYGVTNNFTKPLVKYNGFIKYLNEFTELNVDNFTEEELEEAFDIIQESECPDCIKTYQAAAAHLENLLDNESGDDDKC